MNYVARNLASKNLLAFIMATQKDYMPGWVHREICARLMRFYVDVKLKKSPRLILTMPPRHGKSQIVSKHFPSWVFGVDPDISTVVCSYADDLVRRINKDVQRIMSSDEYMSIFPFTDINARRSSNVSSVRTTGLFEIPGHSGSFRTVGVGGALTGMGGDILIIDDPFKGRSDAESPTMRERVWDWYTSVLYTRAMPGAGILVTVTRWHDDDLVGRLLKAQEENPNADQWELINYPAIAECDEKYRKEGEALHPERYSLETLNNIRENIGSYDWASLYQQRPAPKAGGVIKREWIRFYDVNDMPRVWDRQLQSWDFTFKDAVKSDNVSGQVWGSVNGYFYLLDNDTRKMDFVAQKRALKRMSELWPMTYEKVVEDKANGPAIINSMSDDVSGLIPYNPQGSKIERAYAVSPLFETGRVFVPRPEQRPWVKSYLDELCNFPGAPHDDQVDATTQALARLKHRGGIADIL